MRIPEFINNRNPPYSRANPDDPSESIRLEELDPTQAVTMSDEQRRFLDDYENDTDVPVSTNNEISSTNDIDDIESTPSFQPPPHKNVVVRILRKIWDGPDTPVDNPPTRIRLLLPLEEFPEKFAHRYSKNIRIALLSAYCALWFLLTVSILQPYFTKPPLSLGWAKANPTVVLLSCLASTDFWKGKNAACGMDGKSCPSFKDEGQDIIFRCPAFCDRGSWVYSLAPIGDQRIRYRGYFVGGGADDVDRAFDPQQLSRPYRGDSYLCGAGVHAGAISPFFGGCARISYSSKDQGLFPAARGRYGVGPSIGFDSFFPVSYYFKSLAANDAEHYSHCYDPRLLNLVLNVVLGAPIVYLASGAVTFWVISMVGFWTICLATDPPVTVDVLDHDTYSHLISVGLERMLPTCFILYVLWHSSVRRTFSVPADWPHKGSPVTRLVLWYPLFWIGVLNNITFDRLPLDRLTWDDISRQPGALVAASSILALVSVCAVVQAYKIWLSGRFHKYLAVYGGMLVGLVFIGCLPGLTLRIHHYILALLLIPGCSTRGHTALMFQGILLGLFLLGASRWGLAAIAETVSSLRRDDPQGRVLPPTFLGYNATLGVLLWTVAADPMILPPSEYTDTSLLVNDIERYVGPASALDLRKLFSSGPLAHLVSLQQNSTIYLRLGRRIPHSHTYSDYTNAAVLKWPSGEFVAPPPGVT